MEKVSFKNRAHDVLSDQLSSPAPGMIPDGSEAVLVVDYGGTLLARVALNGETTSVMDGSRYR